MTPPTCVVPAAPAGWPHASSPLDAPWQDVTALPPLVAVADGSPAQQATTVRVCETGEALWVRFDCTDQRITAPRTRRDSSLYEDEVVEVFLAPGDGDPSRYLELEVSPGGVLLDARIDNPRGGLEHIVVDREWDCPGIWWSARQERQRWSAALVIPWRGLDPEGERQEQWRANFCRIDRAGAAGQDEFTCWAPTFTAPADFHRPAAFGHLRRTAV